MRCSSFGAKNTTNKHRATIIPHTTLALKTKPDGVPAFQISNAFITSSGFSTLHHTPYKHLEAKASGKIGCGRSGGHIEGVKVGAPQYPCDMAKAKSLHY